MQKKVVRPPASYFQSSFPPAGSTNLAADMGHPASHERSQFVDLKIDCGSSRTWHFCKHCHRAYNASKLPNGTYSLPEPKRIKGRIENFKSHLKRCEHFIAHGSSTGSSDAATANPTVGGLLCSGDGASTLSQQNPRKQTRIDDYYVGFFEENERQLFERVILEFQADNNLPDTFIERKSTYRLLHLAHTMVIDVSPLPNRKKLGGPVLDRYALACEDDESTALLECQKTTEGRVNFLSDVWQNIARAHLLGCLLWLYGKQLTYGLFQTGSRHDGVAIAAQMERVMIDMQREGWNIGAVVTDNAGQCGRARRLLSLRWPHIAFVICFAHDLNNMVKAVLKSEYATVTKNASDAVNAINASSSKWLVEVQQCMRDTYGYELCLQQLCETRWNSMHACFASLLRVRSAMEMLELKFRKDSELPSKVRVFGQVSFWDTLADAEQVIRPLVFASLKLQRDENTMADVVVCHLDIFAGFSKRPYAGNNLVREVEKRWRQCEQPLMLLALFLHPAHKEAGKKLLNKTALTSVGSLCRIGVYYFRRFKLGEDMKICIAGSTMKTTQCYRLVILRRFTAIGFA